METAEIKMYDTVIIGSGPAGMSASVYASRAGLKTLLVEYDAPGGKLVKTEEIQNWPGTISKGGPELAYEMYQHALAYGTEFSAANITELITDPVTKIHTLKGANGKCFQTKTVILATGTKERTFDLPNVPKFDGRGISYCAICDGGFYRDKVIAVFGGGNAALEEAMYLTEFASKVYLVHRRQEFRAEQMVIDTAKANNKIEFVLDATLVEILETEGKLSGIRLQNTQTDETSQIDVSGIFVYIGSDPRSELIRDRAEVVASGYVLVNEKMETTIPGVYAVGDVCDKILRQVVTATSDGAIAAQEAYHYITNLK